jgi:lysophospholipase L1-like esterase
MGKKIFCVFLGIVLFLVIAEASLRLAGCIFYNTWMMKESSAVKKEKEDFTAMDQRRVEDTARTFSAENNIPLVNNRTQFGNLLNIDNYFDKSGRHPNREGYNIIASNVYKTIKGVNGQDQTKL